MSLDEARQTVVTIDRDRQTFVRENYQQDVEDPTRYDLMLNLATLSLAQATDVVITAYRAKFRTQL